MCRQRHQGKGICPQKCRMSRCRRFGSDRAQVKHGVNANRRFPGSNAAFSHRETPSRWGQRHSGESEANACAVHVVTARFADDVVSGCSSIVKRPCGAAAVVVVHGTIALGGEADWAGFANDRSLRAVLSNLARLATEGVRRVVARSTDDALAAAQRRLVRAGRAFKTPGPVVAAWSVGSL